MIDNNIYINTINTIIELSKRKLCSDVSMIEKQLVKENIKRSEETIESLLIFLEEDKEEIIQFSLKKLELIKDNNEPDEDDDYFLEEEDYEDEEEESNGFSKTFLVDYMLELLLIKKGGVFLETYLKKLRIPNSKKYAKELRDIYNLIK